ncbi:LCP family protein [Candidatus Peregrinibacteria bacterium]|nr:LCP family protein [Candidatus Peregrinibacteria bacterium]
MNFKTKKIRKQNEGKGEGHNLNDKLKAAKKRFFKKPDGLNLGIFISVSIIIVLLIGIAKAFSGIDFKIFLKAAGDELAQDAFGHSNFLVLGTGGGNHDGADLTDTILVASIDNENKLVTMVSIPRDTWITDDLIGNSKINEIYFNAKNHYDDSAKGIEHMKEKVETMMGIPIHYWVKLDFDGFKEFIDAIGGIDVNVEEAINDPFYPKDGTYLYDPFYISAGQHHMDGSTALKYARSRKTTSDFDRANRQQQIIYAVKEKVLQTEIIFDQEKIKNILETLKKNIETNITVKEILTLGSIAADFGPEQISHRLIHDDPTQCGGFLYTPERRFYNGMFVLVPAGGLEFIHMYSDLSFDYPEIAKANEGIYILNGTKIGGVAGENKQILKRFCLNVVGFGNSDNQVEKTTYYYKAAKEGEAVKRPFVLNFLQKMIPGVESTEIPQEYKEKGYDLKADLIIEIGLDYVNSDKYISDPFYSLPTVAAPVTTPSAAESTTEEASPEAETEAAPESEEAAPIEASATAETSTPTP